MLQKKEVYKTLRADNTFDVHQSLNKIADLSSPLVGCVGGSKEDVYAFDTLSNGMNKFNFYAKSCSVM